MKSLENVGSNPYFSAYTSALAEQDQSDIDMRFDRHVYMATVLASGALSYGYTNTAKKTTRHFFAGNGVSSYCVASAFLTQGSNSNPITCNNKTSFLVPPYGRFSDLISVSNYIYGETVNVVVNLATTQTVPAYNGSPTIISAYESDYVEGTTVFIDDFTTIEDYVDVYGFDLIESVNGKMHILVNSCSSSGSQLYVFPPSISSPIITSKPSAFACEIKIKLDTIPNLKVSVVLPFYWVNMAFYSSSKTVRISGEWFGNPISYPYVKCNDNAEYQTWTLVVSTYNDSLKGLYNLFLDGDYIGGGDIDPISYGYYGLPQVGFRTSSNGEKLEFNVEYIEIKSIGTTTRPIEMTTSGTITVNSNPTAGETLTLNNSTTRSLTFVDFYPVNSNQIQIGATASETAAHIATAINDIDGAEFVATVANNLLTVTAYTTSVFSMATTSGAITIGSITNKIPGFLEESATAADSFTVIEGGMAIQENASAVDVTDGMIDGLSEEVAASDNIDCLFDIMDEGVSASAASDTFDGLIEYMGEEE